MLVVALLFLGALLGVATGRTLDYFGARVQWLPWIVVGVLCVVLILVLRGEILIEGR